MPKHSFGAYGPSSKGQGHPVMFGMKPTEDFEAFPEGGGYPKRFLQRAYQLMGMEDPDRVLHVCSGSMRRGICVDIRSECRPTVVADGEALPFRDGCFRWVLIDPPYSEEWARNLYGTGYPKPGRLLAEAARVLQPGGRVGFLHFLVPMRRRPLKLLGVWGITTGAGYAIRAWSLWEKQRA